MSLAAELYPEEAIIEPADLPEVAYIEGTVAEFRQFYKDTGQSLERSSLVLGLANNLRSEIGMGKYRPAADLLPVMPAKARLDILEWTAWNNLLYYSATAIGGKGKSFAEQIRTEEFAANKRLFEDIKFMHRMSNGYESVVYDDLIDSFYMARLAVKNPPGLLAQEKVLDKIMLDQMLSVYRVTGVLESSGFTRARRSTIEERKSGIHAVVPVGKSETRLINIQVQPASPKGSGLETQYTNSRLYVNTPYDTGTENPFVMAPEDKKTLVADLNDARRRKLISDASVKLKIINPENSEGFTNRGG